MRRTDAMIQLPSLCLGKPVKKNEPFENHIGVFECGGVANVWQGARRNGGLVG